MKPVPVLRASAVPEGEARGVEVDGREIVLCRLDGEVRALAGLCTHEALPLDGGEVREGVLTCPWHGARFDVRTGGVLALPALRPLRVYETHVGEDGWIYVSVPD